MRVCAWDVCACVRVHVRVRVCCRACACTRVLCAALPSLHRQHTHAAHTAHTHAAHKTHTRTHTRPQLTDKPVSENGLGIPVMGFEEFAAVGAAKPAPPVPAKRDDLCTIMYTSGTTGDPKACVCVCVCARDTLGTDAIKYIIKHAEVCCVCVCARVHVCVCARHARHGRNRVHHQARRGVYVCVCVRARVWAGAGRGNAQSAGGRAHAHTRTVHSPPHASQQHPAAPHKAAIDARSRPTE